MKNSEAILVTPKQFEIQECAVPEPKDHEILMKVEYVGMCGSTNAASIVVIPSGTWYVHSSGCVMYSQRAPLYFRLVRVLEQQTSQL